MKTTSNKNIGIKEIAERAGVSIGPVDRVLHGRGGVSKYTTERILQAIKDLNYTPNLLASRLKSKREYRIAVIIPKATRSIPYWSAHDEGFEKILSEVLPFGLHLDILRFEQDSVETFIKKTQTVIDGNYDGVFMVPVFEDQTLHLLEKCKQRNVPVIFFDSNIPGQSNISFIGHNSFDSGYMAANLLDLCISANGEILIASIVNKDDNHIQFSARENGFVSYFKNSDRRIVTLHANAGDTKDVRTRINGHISGNTKIEGIFVVNGIEVVAPLIKPKQKNSLRIIGYDLTEKNVSLLKAGSIDFLISQQPQKQAYQGIKMFYDYLILKKTIKKSYYLPLDILMKSNIAYYSNL